MLSEQEKQQFFTMFSQGLMAQLAPGLNQMLQHFGQQMIQQSAAAAQRATPNFWAAPIIVNRIAEEGSAEAYEPKTTTPGQLLAEAVDNLILIQQGIDDLNKAIKPARRKGRRSE